ncbi:hypothetical protein FEM48_Zijuj07G0162700 [Ziziphus jujuba var. spinosa]|uniref:LIM zinc-binding domain-containing protein n=1 Tax=Ziziphus jujuba var. spinosa TaxID=714518 RepID=A0A978V5N1_ZIZJJ|nr:hypothetical protein FEM48_Zijuj07G0162700 [Ziziphus jujuba var. spinosa]
MASLEGECYHKSCFRCAHGKCPLTHSSYAAFDGVLYCKHHFAQLFMETGNFNHVFQAAANRKNATPPPEPADHDEDNNDHDHNNNNNDQSKPVSQENNTQDLS